MFIYMFIYIYTYTFKYVRTYIYISLHLNRRQLGRRYLFAEAFLLTTLRSEARKRNVHSISLLINPLDTHALAASVLAGFEGFDLCRLSFKATCDPSKPEGGKRPQVLPYSIVRGEPDSKGKHFRVWGSGFRV